MSTTFNDTQPVPPITEDDIAKWNRLSYQMVDYTKLLEKTDETKLKDIVACAGGACDVV